MLENELKNILIAIELAEMKWADQVNVRNSYNAISKAVSEYAEHLQKSMEEKKAEVEKKEG